MKVIGEILMGAGLFIMLCGIAGLLKNPGFYRRLLLSSLIDTVGLLVLLAGVAVRQGLGSFSFKVILLVGGITFLAGVFLEEESRTGKWLDAVSIGIVPLSIDSVRGYPRIREELEKGHKGRLSAAFGFAAKYIYVPLTILVLILGYVYNGIG